MDRVQQPLGAFVGVGGAWTTDSVLKPYASTNACRIKSACRVRSAVQMQQGREDQGIFQSLQGITSGVRKVLGLPQKSRRSALLDFDPSLATEFENSEDAPLVLVVGATGRVGRIVVRKLLLRGFRVRAVVRNLYSATLDLLPSAVEIVKVDVRDPVLVLQDVFAGVDKVICLVGARSGDDVEEVEVQGLMKLIQAYHDVRVQEFGLEQSTKTTLFKFSHSSTNLDGWKVPTDDVGQRLASAGLIARPPRVSFFLNEKKNAVLVGKVFEKYNGVAQVYTNPEDPNLRGYSGLVIRVIGDGNTYRLSVQCGSSAEAEIHYVASFTTVKGKWKTFRLPFSSFVAMSDKQVNLRVRQAAELDRGDIRRIALQYTKSEDRPELESGDFYLAVDYIKAYRTQEEPDFVLLSTAQLTEQGLVHLPGSIPTTDMSAFDSSLVAKWRAEEVLRNSGLTYCIIRAGDFNESEGGRRPLLFEQDRDLEDTNVRTVARADIAEVCVRSLLDPRACNICFDAFEGNFAPTSTTANQQEMSLLLGRLKPNT